MKRKTNILFLTAWSYKDALVQTYTLPYIEIIQRKISEESKVYLVTIEQPTRRMDEEDRKLISSQLNERGIKWISFVNKSFFLFTIITWSFIIARLWFLILFRKINFIHSFCTPASAIGLALKKLTGKKLIVDSYEPHAEAMVESGTWKRNSLKFKILFYVEKKLPHHAFKMILTTQAMKDYILEKYSFYLQEYSLKPACVDVENFISRKKNKELLHKYDIENKITCVYAGKFGGFYLTKEVFNFFKAAEDYWGHRFRALLLTNHSKKEIMQWADSSGLSREAIIIEFVSHKDIADYIGLADFAITPFKPIPTKRYGTPIKDGEYWAAGLPVVITKNISDDSDIIEKNNIGYVLKELNKTEYERAVQKIDELIQPSNINSLTKKIVDIARTYRSFEIAENVYEKIYGR